MSPFAVAALSQVFLCSAAICLGMSGCYHTLSCHSRTVSKLWNRLDYVRLAHSGDARPRLKRHLLLPCQRQVGIVILIVGSNYPSLFYGFWCDLHLQVIYTCASCSECFTPLVLC
jgi:adiponectin receptor